MKDQFFRIMALPLIPIAFILYMSLPDKPKELILDDLRRWTKWQSMSYSFCSFCKLFVRLREFRNVVYYRIGWRKYPLAILFPGQTNLSLACPVIGPGLIVQHGYSTVVVASSIGANFHVNQCVNIVWNGDERPTIGNDVTVCAGATIVGGVTIGDNVTVGAGAVVVHDVPSDSLVVGSPARVIPKQKH